MMALTRQANVWRKRKLRAMRPPPEWEANESLDFQIREAGGRYATHKDTRTVTRKRDVGRRPPTSLTNQVTQAEQLHP